MALLLTLDASVFVSVCRSREPGHAASLRLLQCLRSAQVPVVVPAIVTVEVASALSRTGSDPALAIDFAHALLALPLLTSVAVDARFAIHAAQTAATLKLRASDALYVAVAAQYGARLVTLDREQALRAPAAVLACGPDAAAAAVARVTRAALVCP